MKIKVNNLYKYYESEEVIKGVTYNFESGNIYTILGDNGSGKTILLKCIATLLIPDKGSISYDGKDLKNSDDYRKYRSKLSFFLNSSNSLISELTIMQNIKFFLGINNFSYSYFSNEINRLIIGFDLDKYLNKPVKYLSKGTKQKAALVVALMRKSELILLDEPFDGLDESSIEFFYSILNEYVKGSIIIMTSPIKIVGINSNNIYLNKE
jgi:ABC-type multidrug transport system ATPase subunit